MAENAIIGFPDWTDKVTWSGGSYRGDFPASNAGDDEIARVARTSDLTDSSMKLTATLDKERPVEVIGLVASNATISATIKSITRKDADGNTLDTDTDIDIFPEVYPSSELLWEDENWWSGKYRPEEREGAMFTRPYKWATSKLTKTIEFEFKDDGNGDGFFDIAYLAIASAFQPRLNFAYGAQEGFRGARTRSVQARGGGKTFDRLPAPKTFQGAIEYMPRDEAMARGFEMLRQNDINKPFLWWPFPDEPIHWLRTAYIARNRSISRLRYAAAPKRMEFPISVEQVL